MTCRVKSVSLKRTCNNSPPNLDDESTIGKTMEESDGEEGSESVSESDDED